MPTDDEKTIEQVRADVEKLKREIEWIKKIIAERGLDKEKKSSDG